MTSYNYQVIHKKILTTYHKGQIIQIKNLKTGEYLNKYNTPELSFGC